MRRRGRGWANIASEGSLREDDCGDLFLLGDAERRKIPPLPKKLLQPKKPTQLKQPKHTLYAKKGYKWVKEQDMKHIGNKRKFVWREVKIKKS